MWLGGRGKAAEYLQRFQATRRLASCSAASTHLCIHPVPLTTALHNTLPLPAQVYDSILDTLCSQLDVLRPSDASGGPAHAPEVAAALKPLEELRSALSARLQV